MPETLTGDPTTFPAQRAPLDGEPRTAGSVALGFKDSADRTQYLADRLLYLDPGKTGVRRVRRFVDLAALQAAADHVDATICTTKGFGLYEYDAAFAGPEDLPLVVKPTDVGAGLGAWILQMRSIVGGANGVARLDGAGKIPVSYLSFSDNQNRIVASSVRNGTVSLKALYNLSATTVPNTNTPVDIDGTAMSFNLIEGDVVVIGIGTSIVFGNVGNLLGLQFKITKPDLSSDVQALAFYSGGGGTIYPRLTSFHTFAAQAAGAYQVVLQGVGVGPASTDVQQISGYAQALRP